MPTPSEQKALAFVAIVVLLGGAVRVVRAGALTPPASTPSEQQALARQSFAANSSAINQRTAKVRKGQKTAIMARRRPDDGVKNVAGVASVPYSDVRPGLPATPAAAGPPLLPGGYDAASRARGALGPLDLDLATQSELEALPRVGPALARRILANRDSFGPFRSLPALRRVRGIGPATVERLAPLVTFSGQARH
jgi:competence protein ComEA